MHCGDRWHVTRDATVAAGCASPTGWACRWTATGVAGARRAPSATWSTSRRSWRCRRTGAATSSSGSCRRRARARRCSPSGRATARTTASRTGRSWRRTAGASGRSARGRSRSSTRRPPSVSRAMASAPAPRPIHPPFPHPQTRSRSSRPSDCRRVVGICYDADSCSDSLTSARFDFSLIFVGRKRLTGNTNDDHPVSVIITKYCVVFG